MIASNPTHTIRPITGSDDPAMANIVVNILQEFGCVGPGYASSDPEIHKLFETYSEPGSRYLVIADEQNTLWGGGGYSRLRGTTKADSICELQKLYFKPELRGLGLGRKMLDTLIQQAKAEGYERMYLESVPQMTNAISLYQRAGFAFLDAPLGDTGHHSCSVFMVRNLGLGLG